MDSHYLSCPAKSGSAHEAKSLDASCRELADKRGVVPFGDRLGELTGNGVESGSYFSTTLGFRGIVKDGMDFSDVINVNLSAELSISALPLFDGNPRRMMFPIYQSSVIPHWHWIDVTLVGSDNQAILQVHGLSQSKTYPLEEHEFDTVNRVFLLRRQTFPQHATWAEYFNRHHEKNKPWCQNFYEPCLVVAKA